MDQGYCTGMCCLFIVTRFVRDMCSKCAIDNTQYFSHDQWIGAVSISGTVTEGQTLTASNTLADADGLGVISYQWQRNGINVDDATDVTYILGSIDVGAVMTVVASYTDGQGTNENITSAATVVISNVNDAPVAVAGSIS